MPQGWEYLEDACKGNERAWQALVDKYQRYLFRLALMITYNPAAAKDIVQEVFLKLFRVKIRHKGGNFQSYLSVMTYRAALKEKRRALAMQNIEGQDYASGDISPLKSIIKEERDFLLTSIIASLAELHREPLILRFFGDLSYEEIAEVLKIPLGTVKSRIFYAVRKCREEMLIKGIANESLE